MDFGTAIASVRVTHFPSSPDAYNERRKEELVEMITVKQILISFVMVVGLSLAVSAQRNDDQKKPPPKGETPKVEPREKPPPRNPPRDSKPKKP